MKQSPIDFAKAFRRTNGLEHALKLTERLMHATRPVNWSTLPTGPVFYKKDKRGSQGLNEKELIKTHSFWTQVHAILKKSK